MTPSVGSLLGKSINDMSTVKKIYNVQLPTRNKGNTMKTLQPQGSPEVNYTNKLSKEIFKSQLNQRSGDMPLNNKIPSAINTHSSKFVAGTTMMDENSKDES